MRVIPNFEYTHSAEKARDTTLDDKDDKQTIRTRVDRTAVLLASTVPYVCTEPR